MSTACVDDHALWSHSELVLMYACASSCLFSVVVLLSKVVATAQSYAIRPLLFILPTNEQRVFDIVCAVVVVVVASTHLLCCLTNRERQATAIKLLIETCYSLPTRASSISLDTRPFNINSVEKLCENALIASSVI